MDAAALGAALALIDGKIGGATAAVSAANAAVANANKAAQAAKDASAGITATTEEAMHTRIAFNYAYTILQAEDRARQKDIETLQKQVAALKK